MLESSERVFRGSGNKVLNEMGGSNDVNPDYGDGVPVAKFKNRRRYLKLDVKPVTVIGFFGPSGSGKTTGMNSIASRCYDNGRILVNLVDTDFQFNNYKNGSGVSKELIDKMGFYKNESRHSIPSNTLMPKFIYDEMMKKDTLDDPPSYVETFSIGFHQLSQSELKNLFSRGLDKKQRQKIETLLNEVDINQDLKFSDLKDALDEADFHENAKDPIRNKIERVEDSNIVSSRLSKEADKIVDYMNKGEIVGIAMGDIESVLGSDDIWKAEFYASKVAEIVINARLKSDLGKPLLGVLPEAHHLMPAGEETELTKKLKRNFTYYKRRTNFPFIIDSQSPYQLPGRDDRKNILGELNHVFVGRGEDGKTLEPKGFKKILKSMNIIQNSNSSRANAWSERLKDVGWREFLYLRPGMSDPKEAPIVEFLAPLVSNP